MLPPEPPDTVLPLRRAGDQAMEAIYQALFNAMPDAVPACWAATSARWSSGAPRAHARAVDRREPARGRPGRPRPRRRPERVDAHLRGGHARDLRGGRRGEVRGRSWTASSWRRTPRRGPPPWRPGRGLRVPLPRGRADDDDRRAHQERAVGLDGAPKPDQCHRCGAARRDRDRVLEGHARRAAQGRGRAPAHRRRGRLRRAGQRDADAVRADVRDGYLSEARARADHPHAFEAE